jgi:hypothetical protein
MILNGVIVVGFVLTALVKALSPATGDDPGAARGPIGGKRPRRRPRVACAGQVHGMTPECSTIRPGQRAG